MILCDTNILFELFKGNAVVIEELLDIGYDNLAICDVTIGEIYFGMRKGEEEKTRNLIKRFNRYRINTDASKIFVEIMSDLASRQIGIPDALISAVAKSNSLTVFTINLSDFKLVEGLKLYKSKRKLV